MNRKNLSTLLLLLSLFSVPRWGLALQFCEKAIDEKDCEAKVREALLKDVPIAMQVSTKNAEQNIDKRKEKTKNEAERELLAKVSPEIAALPGASAAFEDFLGRLKIGVTSEGPDNKQALALDFTDFLGLPTNDGYKLQAVARDPVLNEALSTQLSEENRNKRSKGLGAFDDVLVAFSYSPSTIHLGKNLGASQILIDELFRRFLAEDEDLAGAVTAAKEKKENLTKEVQQKFDKAFSNDELQRFDLIKDPALQMVYREAVEDAQVAEAKRLISLSKMLTQEFFKIADLVANQPQLVLKATRTVRDELTGPEESTLHVSYEQGFVNMNSLRKALAGCRGVMMTCYADYLTDHRINAGKEQNRLTLRLGNSTTIRKEMTCGAR